jgi:protein HIRA/HIR1
VEYDEPIIPSSGIGSAITGNKRKLADENEITGNKSTRAKPEWIDSAIVPPIVQKSQVKMGLPKVKSILASKLRSDDPTIVMECHNSHSKYLDTLKDRKELISF